MSSELMFTPRCSMPWDEVGVLGLGLGVGVRVRVGVGARVRIEVRARARVGAKKWG